MIKNILSVWQVVTISLEHLSFLQNTAFRSWPEQGLYEAGPVTGESVPVTQAATWPLPTGQDDPVVTGKYTETVSTASPERQTDWDWKQQNLKINKLKEVME